jgi:heterodisulfide reductase subunit D
VSGIFEEPRQIMAAIPGLKLVELADNRQYCNCCGSGGDLLASYEELSLEVARRKVAEVTRTGASTLVSACPSCARAITMARNQAGADFEVVDIAQLVWRAMKA